MPVFLALWSHAQVLSKGPRTLCLKGACHHERDSTTRFQDPMLTRRREQGVRDLIRYWSSEALGAHYDAQTQLITHLDAFIIASLPRLPPNRAERAETQRVDSQSEERDVLASDSLALTGRTGLSPPPMALKTASTVTGSVAELASLTQLTQLRLSSTDVHGDATCGVQCHVGGATAPADGAHGWGLGFYAIGAGESRGAACTASGVGVVPALTDLRHGMTRCNQPQEHFLQRGSRNTELTDEVRAVLQLAEEVRQAAIRMLQPRDD